MAATCPWPVVLRHATVARDRHITAAKALESVPGEHVGAVVDVAPTESCAHLAVRQLL